MSIAMFYIRSCKLQNFIVLMVMGEIGIFNDTAIVLHVQSTLPAAYRCQLDDGQYFPCEVNLHLTLKESRSFCR